MKIRYTLYNGTPNYTVTLTSPANTYTQIHSAQGTYSFDNVPNGLYELSAVDSTGCNFDFGGFEVNNDEFAVIAAQTRNITNSQTIGDVLIKSLSTEHKLILNPSLPETAVATLEVGYQLITTESPIDPLDDIYATASVEVRVNSSVIGQQQVSSNTISGATGTFTINNFDNTQSIFFEGSVITRANATAGKSTSGFFQIYAISMTLNGWPVSINTNSFNISGNLA
jgi:hypothetical protein